MKNLQLPNQEIWTNLPKSRYTLIFQLQDRLHHYTEILAFPYGKVSGFSSHDEKKNPIIRNRNMFIKLRKNNLIANKNHTIKTHN